MAIYCFHCGAKIETPSFAAVGRNETCPSCDSDVHVCLNCQHYDEQIYNSCREPQADRVLDKDKRNFCEFFAPNNTTRTKKGSEDKAAALKKLDDLFK